MTQTGAEKDGASIEGAQAIVAFAYEAGFLKRLPRAGWQLAGVASPESVAEHSFRVGVLAYVIAVQEGGNPDRAATLGLFHDLPETRTSDIASVGKRYVTSADPLAVAEDQVAGLPGVLAQHIVALVQEHESAKTPAATLEAKCSRDADKLECLLQAREYEAAGNTQVEPWITTMVDSVSTETGRRLAALAQQLPPRVWWDRFAQSYGLTELRT
ncbi:HD domain-containing protein [Actinomadura viridis]|uniref:5'-deoxynucleotidase n=1 Tax=Actinomadura viridis TaxID=58110 RepID=A0A931DJQ0_9ACTN|nr:HD domain-containing protein [Actinomadura viridis]MBG6089833.1 putative hydrolase of HD superfamily [Actinomadura viridis]